MKTDILLQQPYNHEKHRKLENFVIEKLVRAVLYVKDQH